MTYLKVINLKLQINIGNLSKCLQQRCQHLYIIPTYLHILDTGHKVSGHITVESTNTQAESKPGPNLIQKPWLHVLLRQQCQFVTVCPLCLMKI